MSESVDIIGEIEERFPPGSEVYKSGEGNSCEMRAWGRSRGERALVHRVHGGHDKRIPVSVFEWTYEELSQGHDVEKSDCLDEFHSVFVDDSCNFTALGGIFERLGYAEQQRGIIVSKCVKAS